ncbi:MAG: flagellar biosynthesis protein FlhF [Porticoccaceae bacterium]|nr:flagellar biosynthesis protein FlhF [Porticoccaceae bacterium]
MNIKRFTGTDMKSTMHSVREHWGPDAVILASRRLDKGVEITAAIDFDEEVQEQMERAETIKLAEAETSKPRPEAADNRQAFTASASHKKDVPHHRTVSSDENRELTEMRKELTALRGLLEGELSQLAWRELGKQHPLRAQLVRRLVGFGLDRQFATRLAGSIQMDGDLSTSWKKALIKISHMLAIPEHNILETGGTIAIVGATGVGKTTSVAKLAGLYALKHGREQVGLVTSDCFRIGGHEQLATFSRILGIPVMLATNRNELSDALDKLSNRKLILIDTAGMSQRDMGLSEQFSTLNGSGHNIQVYLALSAIAQKEITDEVVQVFSDVDLAGTIITKVDEAVNLGGMLSTLIQHRLPTMFISNGQQIPEDIRVAKPIELVKIARDLMERVSWQQPSLPPLTKNQKQKIHA